MPDAGRLLEAAAKALCDRLNDLLPNSISLIAQHIGDRRKAIATEDPILEPLLGLSASTLSRREAAQAFLNQVSDRLEERASPFRPDPDQFLPQWPFDERFWRPLDAPFAAALAVKGRKLLTPAEVMCVKDVARRHPKWFREGFAAAMRDR